MWKIFLDENPGCSYEDLVSAFGPPEIFAREMLNTLDRENLHQVQSGRKRLLCGIAALTMVLMITAAFWFSGQAKPEADKDEQIPEISVITDKDPENPTVFSFGFSMDELKGSFYWNNHKTENNEP